MQIFALETNVQRIKEKFLAPGEHEIFTAKPHWVLFVIKIGWEILITIVLVAGASLALTFGLLSPAATVAIIAVVWFVFAFFGIIEAFIDWKFDLLFLTTDKLVIVNQYSLFRKSITPINLENLGDVVAQTQWLNLFNFGMMHFALKEGHGPEIVLKYMPYADKLVAKIAEQITLYQRRKDFIVPYRSSAP